jgi:hypothetical protein
MAKPFNVDQFIARYSKEIAATGRTLAANMDIPAQRIINSMFEHIGEPCFVGKDDRWDMITAHLHRGAGNGETRETASGDKNRRRNEKTIESHRHKATGRSTHGSV